MHANDITIAFSPNSETQLLQKLDIANFASPVTVQMLVESVGWLAQYPEIAEYEVGIFSQKVTWDSPIQAGDRVEIYRPLSISPMRKRQLLMAQRQKMLNKQRAKNNIAKKQIDKKAYYNALRAEKGD